ncbi:MAG: sulfatase-like hydrolase/transferase, partial [Draconibacterium sp.]|nr:sulfatase-like hydrolase/transferase [Draconibacterium sp.]
MRIIKILTIGLLTITINVFGQEKPNILFIAIDDLKPTLGCYGDNNAITPNIDKIASAGTLMASNYCQQAVCAPSRVSLFTGLRPEKTGVWDLKTRMRSVNPDVVTLPEYLLSNGYETAGLGKLIHGAKNNDPQSWSIPNKADENLVYAEGFIYPAHGKYQNEESHAVYLEAMEKKLSSGGDVRSLMIEANVYPYAEFLDVPDDAYSDGAIASEGIKILEGFSKSKKPFFLALGFHKPHLPFVAPKKYYDLYEGTEFKISPFQEEAKNSPGLAYSGWGELRKYSGVPLEGILDDELQLELIRSYYSTVSYVDAQIGRVYEKLEELGLAENTIVILWGDHGWHLGDHGLWCKHTNFEQAAKTPMIISAPGYPKGQVSYSMTELVDIFPTICDLSGLEIPEIIQGESLVPILKDQKNIV